MSYVLDEEWAKVLKDNIDPEFKKSLFNFVNNEYATKTVYPPKEKIFNSLNYVPLSKVKVVIIGQDPYHVKGQADGLAFSCANGNPHAGFSEIGELFDYLVLK